MCYHHGSQGERAMRSASIPFALFLMSSCTTTPMPSTHQPASLGSGDEMSLRAIDERVRKAVHSGNAAEIEVLTHPAYRVNAPSNRVLTKEEVLGMIRSGAIAADRFERTIESISVAGDVGIVMGREIVEVPRGSESGQLFGTGTLNRRFTNVYLREGSGWLFLARHANVVPSVTAK